MLFLIPCSVLTILLGLQIVEAHVSRVGSDKGHKGNHDKVTPESESTLKKIGSSQSNPDLPSEQLEHQQV